MTRVTINGQEVDIDRTKPVSIKYQGPDLLRMGVLRADYTDPVTVVPTQKSNKVLNNPLSLKSFNPDPLQTVRIDITSSTVPVIEDGRARLSKGRDKITLNVLSGTVNLFDRLEDKLMSELDTTTLNYQWTQFDTANIIEGTTQALRDGAVQFPIMEYADNDAGSDQRVIQEQSGGINIYFELLLPWFRKKNLLALIINQAGYTLDSDLDSEDRFDKHLQMGQPPVAWSSFINGENVIVSEWLDDIPQLDWVKEVLKQYGCYLYQEYGIVYIKKISGFYSNQPAAIDWSAKMDTTMKPDNNFNSGFAASNKYGYMTREFTASDPLQSVEDDSIDIDTDALNLSADYIRLNTAVPQYPLKGIPEPPPGGVADLFIGLVDNLFDVEFLSGTFLSNKTGRTDNYECLLSHETPTITLAAISLTTKLNVNFRFIFNISNTYFGLRNRLGIEDVTYVDGVQDFDLSPTSMIGDYYNNAESGFIKKNRLVTTRFLLTAGDIHNYRSGIVSGVPVRQLPIYVRGLGGYYVIEKINGWIEDRKTSVTLRHL